jgi:hypothetical protein
MFGMMCELPQEESIYIYLYYIIYIYIQLQSAVVFFPMAFGSRLAEENGTGQHPNNLDWAVSPSVGSTGGSM